MPLLDRERPLDQLLELAVPGLLGQLRDLAARRLRRHREAGHLRELLLEIRQFCHRFPPFSVESSRGRLSLDPAAAKRRWQPLSMSVVTIAPTGALLVDGTPR